MSKKITYDTSTYFDDLYDMLKPYLQQLKATQKKDVIKFLMLNETEMQVVYSILGLGGVLYALRKVLKNRKYSVNRKVNNNVNNKMNNKMNNKVGKQVRIPTPSPVQRKRHPGKPRDEFSAKHFYKNYATPVKTRKSR